MGKHIYFLGDDKLVGNITCFFLNVICSNDENEKSEELNDDPDTQLVEGGGFHNDIFLQTYILPAFKPIIHP